MHPLTLRVDFVKENDSTYTLRVSHDFESDGFYGFSKEEIESLSVNQIATKIATKATFKNIIETDMGFYLKGKWVKADSITDYNGDLQIYPSDYCHICGMFSGWKGNPLKIYKGKPHCLICRMADERKANNVRP